MASYTALLLGCLCQGSPVSLPPSTGEAEALSSQKGLFDSVPLPPPQMNVTTVRENLPKGDFSIMTEMLKKFLNFMNLTVSSVTPVQLAAPSLQGAEVVKEP